MRVLRLNAKRTEAITGVTAAQLFVLQHVQTDGGLSVNELAVKTLTDRSSVAGVVERLQAQGLVDRAVDPADRRRARIRITTAGRRMLARSPDAPTTALIAALHVLTPAQRTSLARSLERLNRALGAGHAPASMLFADAEQAIATPRRARGRRKGHSTEG